MEGLEVTPSSEFWYGKRVFLTGHTGFKGSWLSIWLAEMGAEVHGFALAQPARPNLFEEANVEPLLKSHTIGDIRDFGALAAAVDASRPEIVIHMAAQALVRTSYAMPVETYETNVMGTVNLLEAIRRAGTASALVSVTTDKCYENKEWLWAYRENEPLGGNDPYSSSKACAELVTAAYRSSFHAAGRPFIASGRAGNVIGGGDWALDRIIPDALRAHDNDEVLMVRNPGAVRPWQHVLEPLSGYLALAERLFDDGGTFAQAWNFGPAESDAQPVRWIVDRLAEQLPMRWELEAASGVHEANFLRLDSSKARAILGWAPRWDLSQALEKTVAWHLAWRRGGDMAAFTTEQIRAYSLDEMVNG